jgi:transposase
MQFPQRRQQVWHAGAIDELLPESHPARDVWAYAEKLDVSSLIVQIKATEGHVGRPPVHPRILLALWLYATIEGIGSARYLARLTETHAAFKWICGGVSVNYHLLADFRSQNGQLLDDLLTQSVAVLRHEGLVDLNRVAQDGLRVRASAGGSSFHRRPTLTACLEEAQTQLERLQREIDDDPQACRTRSQAAKVRAEEDKIKRLERALEELRQIQAKSGKKPPAERRASSTDPEARVIKFADGGFRPGYNVEVAVDVQTQVVVGIDVTNVGSDKGQIPPMHQQIQSRHQVTPGEYLADGDFMTHNDIEYLEGQGTTAYIPPKKGQDPERSASTPTSQDSPIVAGWRARMATSAAQAIYKQRAASIECVNAQFRNHGLRQVLVRGLEKVKAIALWHALAQNFQCLRRLAPQLLVQ